MVADLGMRSQDVVMLVTPMFHGQSWGLPQAAVRAAAKVVLPGRYTAQDTKVLVDAMIAEGVTVANGAPAIFQPMLDYISSLAVKPDLSRGRLLSGATEPPLSLMRGPWIAESYAKLADDADRFLDGYWRSGDAGVIDKHGYLKITDRLKDVIKSGGEWISSIDMENAITSHPRIREAAVIGVEHPTWQERPVVIAVTDDGTEIPLAEIHALLPPFARWQLPDTVVYVDAIPRTSVGKIDKKALPGWLATTTRRECIRVLPTPCRTHAPIYALDAENLPDEQADPADQELLAAERRAALREAFDRLPPDGQQLIAILITDPPVPYTEISARLGIPRGSIGPNRRRCLAKLRRDPAISALIDAPEVTRGRQDSKSPTGHENKTITT
jgi:RNA polymerase sigma factor (sigma-70 family)